MRADGSVGGVDMNNRKEQDAGKEHPIVAFWHKNNKTIKKLTGILGVIGAFCLMVKGGKYLWNATAFDRWLSKAPLDEVKETRHNIHMEALHYTTNDEYRNSLWNMLPILDRKIRELEWTGKEPSGPAYHREHGYNLYKPD